MKQEILTSITDTNQLDLTLFKPGSELIIFGVVNERNKLGAVELGIVEVLDVTKDVAADALENSLVNMNKHTLGALLAVSVIGIVGITVLGKKLIDQSMKKNKV